MSKKNYTIKNVFVSLFIVILISMQFVTVFALSPNIEIANASTTELVDFSDVKSTDWFYNDVLEARRLGLISGVGNNEFAPNKTITYAEYIAVLTRILGVDIGRYSSGSHWASQHIEAAQELGIINGLEKDAIDSAIPRQDMVVFSCKALGIKPLENQNEYIFADSKGKNKEQTAYINAAYKEYLTDGIEKNVDGIILFGYDKPVTRAQLATMVLRIKAHKDNSEQYKKEREKIRKLETDIILHGSINVTGNTGGNLANGGSVAIQGDWIYYNSMTSTRELYKIRTDGSKKTKLCDDNATRINVVGDWIYYTNIDDNSRFYKIRTDGSDKTKINDYLCLRYPNVVGDWIYFAVYHNEDFKICKMRTDGSELTIIGDDQAYYLNVVDDWIYYQNMDDGCKLYKIRTDGSERTKICDDDVNLVNVEGDWVYYLVMDYKNYDQTIYKIRKDGSGRTKIYDSVGMIEYINVAGDWIYFGDCYKFYKIRNDGSNITKICDDSPWFIHVVGDWIYYTNTRDNYKDYRIRTDGSERQPLN